MLACSTASLGALSLSATSLGQSKYDASFCAWYDRQDYVTQNQFPAAAATACDLRAAGGAVPSGAPPPTGNGNGNDTAMWGFLSSLVGAVPGMIHGAPPTAPPPLVQQPAARTGRVMLPLIAVGVVVWMFARAPARRS